VSTSIEDDALFDSIVQLIGDAGRRRTTPAAFSGKIWFRGSRVVCDDREKSKETAFRVL
jgi:hypothetical protein